MTNDPKLTPEQRHRKRINEWAKRMTGASVRDVILMLEEFERESVSIRCEALTRGCRGTMRYTRNDKNRHLYGFQLPPDMALRTCDGCGEWEITPEQIATAERWQVLNGFLNVTLRVRPSEHVAGEFVARWKRVGIESQGPTPAKALLALLEAMTMCIEGDLENGLDPFERGR